MTTTNFIPELIDLLPYCVIRLIGGELHVLSFYHKVNPLYGIKLTDQVILFDLGRVVLHCVRQIDHDSCQIG